MLYLVSWKRVTLGHERLGHPGAALGRVHHVPICGESVTVVGDRDPDLVDLLLSPKCGRDRDDTVTLPTVIPGARCAVSSAVKTVLMHSGVLGFDNRMPRKSAQFREASS